MSCALAGAAGVLWLCLLRRPVAPAFLLPVLDRSWGDWIVRGSGAGLLIHSMACWIARDGAGTGVAEALVVMMGVGAPTTFLLPRRRTLLGSLLVACLLGWAVALLSGT